MSDIVTISGSPFPSSRSLAILDYVQQLSNKHELSITSISVRDLPPEDLVYGNFESLELKKIQRLIEQAKAVIFC
jgi:FMN reductase